MSEAEEPLWITYEQAIAIHTHQLRRFGGAPACATRYVCDRRWSARSTNGTYEQAPLAELAAAYAFGLAKNHAFVDGNKRIAFMAMMVFLRRTAYRVRA